MYLSIEECEDRMLEKQRLQKKHVACRPVALPWIKRIRGRMNVDLTSTSDSLALLKDAFETVLAYLRPKLAEAHTYHFISFRETKDGTRRIGEWIKSGAGGSPPTLDTLHVRAHLYSFGRSASDAQAYRIVFLNTCYEFMEAALPALRLKKLTVPLTLARSIVERFAVAIDVTTEAQVIIQRKADGQKEAFDNLVATGELFTVALLGTKVDWTKLSTSNLSSTVPKSLGYSQREHELDLAAKRVGSRIKSLEVKIPGAGIAYETLCEFLHPNIGDYFSSVLEARKSSDSVGAKHIQIELGRGQTDLATSSDIDAAIARVIRVVIDVVSLFPELDRNMKDVAERLLWRTQKFMRPLVKSNRAFFSNSDPCPCQSGKEIAVCCMPARR
jgi:hypothetical protein